MKTISLFTGAGGLDLGLEAVGLEPAICVELDEDSRSTLADNRRHWRLLNPGDIHAHTAEDVVNAAGLRPKEAMLVSGGPPCQPFSKAALWVNGTSPGLGDARAQSLKAYMNVAEVALPQFLILENVRGLSASGKNTALEMLRLEIDRINGRHGTRYKWSVICLNAADLGAPQVRERLYLVADRDGRILEPPTRTHGPYSNNASKNYLTAWDAIGDLDKDIWDDSLAPRGKWADLLPSIPEGWNYLWHTKRGGGLPLFGWRTKFWSFLQKLAKAKPSWTLSACPGPATGPFHWRNRLLSIKELCRLQTFPDDYMIKGNYSSARRQIGNAVLPLIGEILGKEICQQWLGIRVHSNLVFLPARRNDQPRRQPVRSVPKKYLFLVGAHKPHPGVGKGPGARARMIRGHNHVKGD